MQYYIPENYRFGGGSSATTMHPVVIVWLIIASILMLALPRKYVAIPLLFAVLLTPFGEQLYIAGVHLYVDRILVFVGWIRLKTSPEKISVVFGGLTTFDKIFALWALCRVTATCLLFREIAAIVNQVAFLWDTLGAYFLLRYLIRDKDDAMRVVKALAVIMMVIAVGMASEQLGIQNVFGRIGGRTSPYMRDAKLRAFGPFVGPIPAGTFGATLFGLFLWLYFTGRNISLAVIGAISAVVMVLTSMSSTPLMTLPATLLAITFWPLRRSMRLVRWALVLALLLLQVAMKAPFWWIINHIDLVGGNSSYHRAMIVDAFVNHFSEWWLIGVESSGSWGYDMWDQANQFVSEGEKGGLVTFILFVGLVCLGFKLLGEAIRVAHDRAHQWSLWLLGATLFSFVVSFFGISFSDQAVWGWIVFLVIISASTRQLFSHVVQ